MSVDPIASQLSAGGVAYAPAIAAAAKRYGVDPDLLAAVAAQETGGPDTNAGSNIVGDGGHGRGLFQIDDRWHAFAASGAAMDPAKNADYAASMISGLLKRYGGNVHEALSAYNSGSPTATGTATRWADGSTLGYADSVMRHYQRLTGSTPVDEAPTSVASVGALQRAAAPFPQVALNPTPAFRPPALPSSGASHAPAFHRQATDYGALLSAADDENDS